MCADREKIQSVSSHRPPLLSSVLRNKCPHCRKGDLYCNANPYNLKHVTDMPEKCPVCGQPYEIEVGFWYGTGYVSYALAVMVTVASFIAWIVLVGISLHDNRLFWWMGINAALLIVLQPPMMRLSRSIWFAFFVHYDPATASLSPDPTVAVQRPV